MSLLEFALLRFDAVTAAEKAFGDARDRSTPTGHYIDVDEALHVSELEQQLQSRLARAGSAIALIAQTADVDDMLVAIGETDGTILRQPLSASDLGSLEADLRPTPEASRGPSFAGQRAAAVVSPNVPPAPLPSAGHHAGGRRRPIALCAVRVRTPGTTIRSYAAALLWAHDRDRPPTS
jgi:hypothetical protein